MKILFFLEPSLELNDPYFRYATLRNVIRKQAQAFRQQGHDVRVLAADHLLERAVKDGIDLPGPSPVYSNAYTAACVTAGQNPIKRLEVSKQVELSALVKSALPDEYVPDFIVIWESAAEYMRSVFPDSKIIYQMPGIFSRPPFADSITVTKKLLDPVEYSIREEEAAKIEFFRHSLIDFYQEKNPFISDIKNIKIDFGKVILVPLQVDGYFMVEGLDHKFSTQFEFLIYVLENVPSHFAVVATQYKGRNGLGSVLSQGHINYLREVYSNFVYIKKADIVPFCSQYLAPMVDGVVGLSSSIVAHGALWKKPVLAFGKSHVSEFASARTFEEFVQQIELGERPDRDQALGSFIAASQITMADLLEDPTSALGLEGSVSSSVERHIKGLDFDAALASQPHPAVESYREIILRAAAGCSVISFDIFDTLLVRTYAHPTDVFEIVGKRYAHQLGVTAQQFSACRKDAERRAFQKAVEAGKGEITLEQIYSELAVLVGRGSAVLEVVSQYEIEIEKECLKRRESVCAAFDQLKKQGRKIILVSDMYLPPEVLREVLELNGISGYDKLYVSCEVGVKKHSGKLFDYVLNELQILPAQMLHVGDNEHGDIKMAQARGINTIHVKRPWQAFEESRFYADVWSSTSSRHEMDLKRVLAVAAKDQFAEVGVPTSWFDGDPKKLGYLGLGPLLLDYTNWIIRNARKNGVTKLFFLARDGKIMKEAYDRLSALVPEAPPSHYLLCSRRAVNVANLTDNAAIERLLEIEYTKGTLASYVESRFGLPAHKIPEQHLARHGVSLDTVVGTSADFDIKPFIRAMSEVILQNATVERELYLDYLRDVGFNGDGIAVVDIGYAGTMQESLCALAGLDHLDGYYVVTFRPALERMRRAPLSFHGYLGNFIDRHDTTQLWARHVPMYETMFSTEETSFVKFVAINGRRTPVYMPAGKADGLRVDVVTGVRHGAIGFVESVIESFGAQATSIDIGPEKSLKTLATYFSKPTKEDALILQGVTFEDAYGGGRGTVLLGKESVPGEVWRDARAVLGDGSKTAGVPARRTEGDAVISGGVMFNATHLQTGIGVRARTSYQVPEGAADGMLCYGPYRKFAPGKWIAVFVFHTDREITASMYLEVVIGQAEIIARQKLQSRSIMGTHSFYIDFEIKNSNQDVEFRTFIKDANISAGLKILSISAYPSPEKIVSKKKNKNLFF